MNLTLAAVILLRLGDLNNVELAAFNNAVNGFGRLDRPNIAFDKALEIGLIKPDGTVPDLEETQAASAHAVNERLVPLMSDGPGK